MRQIEDEEVRLARHTPDHRTRLAEVRLPMADGQDEGGTGGGEVEHGSLRSKGGVSGLRNFETHSASGEGQLSLTDPDSRAMHAATRVGVGYNIQIAVDAKHKLIAEQQVHNKVSDLGLLAETAVVLAHIVLHDRHAA